MACRQFSVATGWPSFYGYGVPSAVPPGRRQQKEEIKEETWACGRCSTSKWLTGSPQTKRQLVEFWIAAQVSQLSNQGRSVNTSRLLTLRWSQMKPTGIYALASPSSERLLKDGLKRGGRGVCQFVWHCCDEWIKQINDVDGDFVFQIVLILLPPPFCFSLAKAPLSLLTESASCCYATIRVARVIIE